MLTIGECDVHCVCVRPHYIGGTKGVAGIVLAMHDEGRDTAFVLVEEEWRAIEAYANAEFLRQRIAGLVPCES